MTAAPPTVDVDGLHQALTIQRKKFLVAINKLDQGDGEDDVGTFNQAEDQLVENVTMKLFKFKFPYKKIPSSKPWTDDKATLRVKDILQGHAVFQLFKYLDCADVMCKLFAVKRRYTYDCIPQTLEAVFLYLLTHARQYGDPTKTIFQLDASDPRNQMPILNLNYVQLELSTQSSRAAIVTRAEQLISELRMEYDDSKLHTLNANITSFTLVLLRRFMKEYSRQHATIIHLVIEAYVNCDDEKTKKNVWDTCVKYLQWYKMQLPGLYFKVAELYDITEGELWDLLSSVKSKNVVCSLITLATEYYNNHQIAKGDPTQTQHWFPYCRVVDEQYHLRLSNSSNAVLCTILSNLIKEKGDYQEPAYTFTCPNDAQLVKWVKEITAILLDKIKKS